MKIQQSRKLLNLLKGLDQETKAIEKGLAKQIRRFFTKLQRKIIKEYLDTPEEYLPLLSLQLQIIMEKEWSKYEDVLLNYNQKAATIGLLYNKLLTDYSFIHAREVGLAAKSENMKDIFSTNESVSDKIMNNTFEASDKVKSRVTSEINSVLADAYRDSLGREDVTKKINEKFTQLKAYESRRIAVTEINSNRNVANYTQIQNDGVKYKQWVTAEDGRVRPTHMDLNGHIVRTDSNFSNGLAHPGDKNGPIREWVNCRCVLLPYFIPWGKKAPELTEFTEEQLLNENENESIEDIFKKFSKPREVESTLGEEIKFNWDIPKKDINISELSNIEKKSYYDYLKQKNKLSFIERSHLRQLEEAGVGFEGVINEIPEVTNYAPTSWKYSENDKKIMEEIRKKRKNKIPLTKKERELKRELNDKEIFNNHYKRYLNNNKVDYADTNALIKYFRKYKESWNIPKLTPEKLTLQKPLKEVLGSCERLSRKFALSQKESKELNLLMFKRKLGETLTHKEELKLLDLSNQKSFNYLYSMKIENKGLDYDTNIQYQNLFIRLKTKLRLSDSLLDPLISHVEPEIPLQKVTDKTRFKKFVGTDDEGLLPNGESLDTYFTLDTRKLSPREKQVADRWLTSDYRLFTIYESTGRNIEKTAQKYIENPKLRNIRDMITAKRNARRIEWDCKWLDNILNNQLKKPITTWRVQEEHFLSSTEIGSITHQINFRSTAISKEGALWFSKTNSKPMKYIIEYELPAGTTGAYFAPIKKGEIIGGEYNGEPYAWEMEFLLKEHDYELVEFNDKKIKGAMGEDLIHIKLKLIK